MNLSSGFVLQNICLAALMTVSCSGTSNDVREACPTQAHRLFADQGFLETARGFEPRLRSAGASASIAQGAGAGDESLARRGRLHLALPARGEAPAILTLGSLKLEVYERDLFADAQQMGDVISYERAAGSASYWSASAEGAGTYEEWVQVANATDAPVAEWILAGGTLRQMGDEVEVLDADGVARVRVSAPRAITADGRNARAWLVAQGRTISLYTDARGPALVDPIWTSTLGSSSTVRSNHTATLLLSGQVLVAGGTSDGSTWLKTAELFDPTTGTWRLTCSMNTARGFSFRYTVAVRKSAGCIGF